MKTLWNKTLKNPTIADTVQPGSGIKAGTGTVHKVSKVQAGGLVKYEIYLDLTGLDNGGAAGDIIGDATTANCHLGQIEGTIVAGKVTCLELPTTADPDIDLYAATEATGTEDAPITGLTETLLLDSGDLTLGSVGVLTAFPTTGQYLYLVAGAGATVFNTYDAGKILIELWGTQ